MTSSIKIKKTPRYRIKLDDGFYYAQVKTLGLWRVIGSPRHSVERALAEIKLHRDDRPPDPPPKIISPLEEDIDRADASTIL